MRPMIGIVYTIDGQDNADKHIINKASRRQYNQYPRCEIQEYTAS